MRTEGSDRKLSQPELRNIGESLAKEYEDNVCIKKFENVDLMGSERNVLSEVLKVINLLTSRMTALEGQMSSLKGKKQKTLYTNAKRYGKVRLPIVVTSYAKNANNFGDDHDAVLRERELENIIRNTSDEEERYREVKEIREYRMNRFFYKKSSETELLNQRPVRHFVLPDLTRNLTKATVYMFFKLFWIFLNFVFF